MFVSTLDNRLTSAFHREGNTTVTFDGLRLRKQVGGTAIAIAAVVSITVAVITVLNVPLVR